MVESSMTHSSSGAFSASNKASHTPFYASRRKRRHTEENRGYVFVALDRTSKLAFAELQPRATKMLAADILRRVLAAIP